MQPCLRVVGTEPFRKKKWGKKSAFPWKPRIVAYWRLSRPVVGRDTFSPLAPALKGTTRAPGGAPLNLAMRRGSRRVELVYDLSIIAVVAEVSAR